MDFQALLDEEKNKLKFKNNNSSNSDVKLKSFLFGNKKITNNKFNNSFDDEVMKEKIKNFYDEYMKNSLIIKSNFNLNNFNLNDYVIGNVPTCYYIPDFV